MYKLPRQIVLGNDVRQQYADLKSEIDSAITEVIASGEIILGKAVTRFEADFAAYCGTRHAVGVGSCTDGLFMALTALGAGPGDEVITSPVTFVATAAAIARTGAKPVFADIDPETYTLAPDAVSAAITERTKAIVPVHLFGLTADMDPLRASAHAAGVAVLEDAAQAVGSRYWDRPAGSLGDAAVFSFFPTKSLGCYGDGGAVVTNEERTRDRIRRMRDHGFEQDGYVSFEQGVNSRLDSIQAAVLSVKMKVLQKDIDRRIEVAGRYDRLLAGSGITAPGVPFGRVHAFHQYTVRVPGGRTRRDETLAVLRKHGVDARVFYGDLAPNHPSIAGASPSSAGRWPEAESYSDQALSLPCHPHLTEDQQAYVCTLLKHFY